MKTERRHELRENDLAQQIELAVEALRRHGAAITVGTAVALVLVVIAILYVNRRTAARQEAWELLGARPLAVAKAPDERVARYAELAERRLDPTTAALALKSAADTAVNALAEAQLRGDPAAAKKWADQARELYTRLENEHAGVAAAAAAAAFGLGILDEEQGAYDEARRRYEKIIGDPRFAGTPYAEQAQYRLDHMEQWNQKITFAPGLPPVVPVTGPPPPATQPGTTPPPPATQPVAAPPAAAD